MLELHPLDDTLNLALTLRRYHAFGPDAANWYDGSTFKKVFALEGHLYLLALFEHEGFVVCQLFPRTRSQRVWAEAQRIARHTLGLDFPLKEFYAFAESDPVLRKLIQQLRGLQPTLAANLFEILITSITAQQINLRFAFTVRSRLVRRYGEKLLVEGEKYFAFPRPEKLARARAASLRALQFTQKKSEYIIGLARAICDGELNLERLPDLADDEIAEQLMRFHGVGRWTVDWLLARGLGRGHAIAAGDLGVRKAIQHFYFNGENKSEQDLRNFAQRWGEHTNLAVHYLLTGLALGT